MQGSMGVRKHERALDGARTTTDRWGLLKGWSALLTCMGMKENWILLTIW